MEIDLLNSTTIAATVNKTVTHDYEKYAESLYVTTADLRTMSFIALVILMQTRLWKNQRRAQQQLPSSSWSRIRPLVGTQSHEHE